MSLVDEISEVIARHAADPSDDDGGHCLAEALIVIARRVDANTAKLNAAVTSLSRAVLELQLLAREK